MFFPFYTIFLAFSFCLKLLLSYIFILGWSLFYLIFAFHIKIHIILCSHSNRTFLSFTFSFFIEAPILALSFCLKLCCTIACYLQFLFCKYAFASYNYAFYDFSACKCKNAFASCHSTFSDFIYSKCNLFFVILFFVFLLSLFYSF